MISAWYLWSSSSPAIKQYIATYSEHISYYAWFFIVCHKYFKYICLHRHTKWLSIEACIPDIRAESIVYAANIYIYIHIYIYIVCVFMWVVWVSYVFDSCKKKPFKYMSKNDTDSWFRGIQEAAQISS